MKLSLKYKNRDVLYGSKVENRSIDEIRKILDEGDSIILVDNARIENLIDFEPLPEGNIGVHASEGVFEGKEFGPLRSPEQFIALKGDWVLLKTEGKVLDAYIRSLGRRSEREELSEEIINEGRSILLQNVDTDFNVTEELYSYLGHLKLGFINKYVIINRDKSAREGLFHSWNSGGLIVHLADHMYSSVNQRGILKEESEIDLDVMWRYIWKNNNHSTHLILTDYTPYLHWYRSQGYSIIDMDGTEGDLNGTSKEIIDGLLTRKTYIMGNDVNSVIFRVKDERRAFGNWLRWTVMHSVDRYIGVGDEIESVDMRRVAGIRGTHWNIKRALLFEWDNIPDLEGTVVDTDSKGQDKLDAVDFPILMEDSDYIIIIGGSPGDHFQRYNFGDRRVINYDPRPMIAHKGIEHRQVEYDGWLPDTGSFVLIMDIRTDSPDMKNKEDGIYNDNILMRDWSINAIKTGRCVALSMKFRFARSMKNWKLGFKGKVIFQPYVGGYSQETRLFWWRDRSYSGHEMINQSAYKKKTKSWNLLRQRDMTVEEIQKRGIAELAIRLGDFSNEEGTFVSLFAVSNVMNVKGNSNPTLDFLRSKKYIVCLPEANVSRFWKKRLGIYFDKGVMVDGSFRDKLYTGFQEGYSTYDMNTFVWYMRQEHNIKGYAYDGSGSLTQLWFVETNTIDDRTHQTLVNNQTHHVKYFTSALREILNHDNETLHAVRRMVLSFYGVEPINDTLVNGYDRQKDMFIAVAGHMINMLLATHWSVIDLNRYMNTVESNVRRIKGDGPLFEGELQDKLWHSYEDWVYAVKTYEIMANAIFNFVHKRETVYVMNRLESIFAGVPRRESYHAELFRSSEDGIAMLAG